MTENYCCAQRAKILTINGAEFSLEYQKNVQIH